MKHYLFVIALFIYILLALTFLFLSTSCTYSINMIHSEGTATDMIDETQSAQPDIKPNLNIPAI